MYIKCSEITQNNENTMEKKHNNTITATELRKLFSSKLNRLKTEKDLKTLFCAIKGIIEPKYWNSFKKYHFYYDSVESEKQNFFAKIKFSRKKIIDYREKVEKGDLKKEMSIVNGILAQHIHSKVKGIDCYGFPIVDSNSKNTVFFQFGLFLRTMSDRKDDNYKNVEPIIDQHSIRAYKYFINEEREPQEIEKIEETDVKEYKKWHYKQMQKFLCFY